VAGIIALEAVLDLLAVELDQHGPAVRAGVRSGGRKASYATLKKTSGRSTTMSK
jgi:hypothetical protein